MCVSVDREPRFPSEPGARRCPRSCEGLRPVHQVQWSARMFRRYACVRQADQSDCGPSVLATIALHHGVRISRERLRDVTGTDRVGTNLAGLLQGAEKLGLRARAVRGDWAGLATIPLPAIAHVRTPEGLGHYVVIHRVL